MTVAQNIRDIAQEAEPVVGQWLDTAEVLAGFRDAAKEKGINWSQLKALLVAKIRDSKDGGDRLKKLTDKFDLALTYADMLLNKNVADDRKNTPQSPTKTQINPAANDLQAAVIPPVLTHSLPPASNCPTSRDAAPAEASERSTSPDASAFQEQSGASTALGNSDSAPSTAPPTQEGNSGEAASPVQSPTTPQDFGAASQIPDDDPYNADIRTTFLGRTHEVHAS